MPCKEIIECQQGWPMFWWDIFYLLYTFHMILTTDNIWQNWISRFSVDFRTDEMPKIYLKKKPGEIFPVVNFPKWESEKIFIFHNYSNGFPRKTSANRGLITRVVLCYLYRVSVFPSVLLQCFAVLGNTFITKPSPAECQVTLYTGRQVRQLSSRVIGCSLHWQTGQNTLQQSYRLLFS